MRSPTEARNPNTTHIDTATTQEMLAMIQAENINAAAAVGEVLPMIGRAVDCIVAGMKKGGRLFYIGAGTSGRLGVLDAAECPPTYGVEPGLVVGILAGGAECMFRASEGEEDNGAAGVRDLALHDLTACDTVVGISVAGNAAYVADALLYAKELGCTTVAITSNPQSRLAEESDLPIVVNTGAEPITGSTRMKAGSAQKMILNMLSTCAMVQTGKVYENLMINLRPTNVKLRARVISIVQEICRCSEERAVALLEEQDWSIRRVADTAGKKGE